MDCAVTRKIVFLFGAWWILACLLCGQEDQPRFDRDKLEARIAEIESAQDLEQPLKDQLLELYRKALTSVESAAKHRAAADAFRDSVEGAPVETEEIRRQLEAVPESIPESLVPEGATAKELESLLAKEQVKQADYRNRTSELDAQVKAEQDRPRQLEKQMAQAQENLESVKKELGSPPAENVDPRIAEARKISLEARKDARIVEIQMLEQEELSQPARSDLLSVKQELAKRLLNQADARVAHLQEALNEQRRREAEEVREEAEQAAEEAEDKHPVVTKWAQKNADLGRELTEMIEDTGKFTRRYVSSKKELDQLKDDFGTTRKQLEQVGLNKVLSKVLRNQRNKLTDRYEFRKRDKERTEELSEGEVKLILHEDELFGLKDLEAAADRVMEKVDDTVSEYNRQNIRDEVKSLLAARADLLKKVLAAYVDLVKELGKLDLNERDLRKTTEEYAAFIDQKLLWIASASEFGAETVTELGEAVAWLAAWDAWSETVALLGKEAWSEAAWTALAVLVFSALIVFRRRIRRVLEATGDKVGKVHHDTYFLTVKAMLATFLIALPWILFFSYISWLLQKNVDASEFSRAVGAALSDVAMILSLFLVLYHLCRPGGVAIAHFRWPKEPVRQLRSSLWRLLVVVAPAVFVMVVMEEQGEESHQQSLGRLAFIMAMLALSLFFYRILRRRGGLMESYLSTSRESWVARLRFLWYPAAVGFPLALAVLAVLGFYYAAKQLSRDLFHTIYFLTLVLVIYDLILRWILVAQRRLALAKARERREAERAMTEGEAEELPVALDETELDAATISTQSRKLARVIVGFTIVVGLWMIWEDVLPALGILDTVELWHYVEEDKKIPVTLTSLLLAALVLLVTLVATRNIPGVMEMVVLRRLPLDAGSRYAVTTISRYLIVAVGIVVTFNMLGMHWSSLQWLVAALGVGLGFGLQEIVANFVSGIIILFERPVRVGDTVTVNGIDGIVSRIRIRATTITDWDQKELIIPNKSFITTEVINWTLSSPVLRRRLPVGIAYGSDTALAYKLLLELADAHPLVLKDPTPRVLFLAFGESSLDFELRFYMHGIQDNMKTLHELRMAIDQSFRENGIEIAFPQRDLHIRSVDRPLPITQVPNADADDGGEKT